MALPLVPLYSKFTPLSSTLSHGAVFLIDQDWVADVFHRHIFEVHAGGDAVWRRRPCLDPNSVQRPHFTFSTVTCWLPSPNEIQSSPVFMSAPFTVTPLERPMWIPSVFALSPGAVMVEVLEAIQRRAVDAAPRLLPGLLSNHVGWMMDPFIFEYCMYR
nr:hypothetical protein Iba_chr09bCG3860 [Ipomoea batatas]